MILSGSECTLKSRFSWRSFSVTELHASREKRLAINTTPRVNRLDCGELAEHRVITHRSATRNSQDLWIGVLR
jgi:hypothetical protein